MPPPAILTELPYFMTDFRGDNPRGTKTRGTIFLCGFSADLTDGHMLVGMNNMLWWVETDMSRLNRHLTSSWLHRQKMNSYMQVYRFVDADYVDPRCTLINVQICGRTGRVSRHPIFRGVLINVHHLVIRLQRWIRRVCISRPRAIALAMSLHARLGAGSSLSILGEDMLSFLIKF